MGGGTTFSASPAKKKGQVYIAKGKAPWYNEYWEHKDKVIKVDTSVSGQATVTCDGNVTNMFNMFWLCDKLTSIDLSNFDTSNVTDMCDLFNTSNIFSSYSALTTLNISNLNTSNVTNMSSMFCGCNNLTTLDLSSFDTSNVVDMSFMFAVCSGFTTLDISNFDTSNVTDMSWMFSDCSNLTTIKGIIDMKSCTNYGINSSSDGDSRMFRNCHKLKGVKIKNPPAGFDGAGLSSSQYTIVN